MSDLHRATDWAQTPLGPMSGWPVSLKTAAALVFGSCFPMALLWGPELVRIYNDAYRPLLGAEHPAAMGRPARVALRDRWEASQPLFRQVMDEGETVFLSERISSGQADDGAPRTFVTICYSPVLGEDDTVGGVLVTIVDDTPQVSARRALQASESRYRMLFESMDEGFCLVEMIFDAQDRAIDFRFLEANPAFRTLTGLAAAHDARMRELVSQLEADWSRIFGEVAVTGQAARFRRRSGRLGRWFDVYAFRYGAPELGQIALLLSDITLQVEAEEALAAGHRRLQHLSAALERLSQSEGCRVLQDEVLRAARLLAQVDGVSVVIDFGETFYCDGRLAPGGVTWNDRPDPLILELAERALSAGRAVVITDLAEDARLRARVEPGEAIRSIVMIPVGGTKLAGAIATYWFAPRDPDREEIDALEVFA
uniref:PAS domain-containing protein n=1 Tax=Aromatoleum sp. TaxID=2307007 RepID=UPI002FCAC4C6